MSTSKMLGSRASTGIAIAAALLAACAPKDDQASSEGAVMTDSATAAAAAPREMPTPNDQQKAVLDELASLGGKPIETLTPAEARKQPTPADAVKKLLEKQGKSTAPEPVAKVVDRKIAGPGGQIPIRIYTPAGAGPFPVIVYYHGGGFVIADLDTYDASPRALANAANAVVVSSHYRQAPEHKFPASHEDAFAAYQWTVKNAASIKGDPKRVAVAGESAGGNLAANVAIMARDKQVQMPVHMLLVYPVAGSDMNTASYQENANAKPLNKAMMSWFVEHTLKSPAEAQDPRINLLGADLKGLPSTTIIAAEIDPLRTEGETLAQKLKDAGVDTEHSTYEGAAHEFFGMAAVVDKAKDAQGKAADGLKKAFNK
ncbi:MAG: alpha/beta hydrolase [Anaerolineae bacterium]|nr:alpha/beta hydrolase [Gemmatimonadaceae bacterium]